MVSGQWNFPQIFYWKFFSISYCYTPNTYQLEILLTLNGLQWLTDFCCTLYINWFWHQNFVENSHYNIIKFHRLRVMRCGLLFERKEQISCKHLLQTLCKLWRERGLVSAYCFEDRHNVYDERQLVRLKLTDLG